MKSDTLLDYAVFQLSPKRSRCELIVSSDGNTEKLASGSVTPFLTHLKVAEEQAALAVQSIKLEIDRLKNADMWFTKGTVERFVQFVGTPEILETVNTLDAEMSQLEAARRIYSQGAGDQRRDSQGGNGTGAITAADATTKELLRAIDVRLGAVRQDLTIACGRASATGFTPNTVSQLKHFADQFGAHRLNEACTKYISLYERRPDLMPRGDDRELRSSVNSDMSIDNDDDDHQAHLGPNEIQVQAHEQPKPSTWQHPKPFATIRRSSSNNNVNQNDQATDDSKDASPTEPFQSTPHAPPARRLSVQDRINLFENKQKESSSGGGGSGSTSSSKPVIGKSVELRRLSSDVSSAATAEKSVLRRWSGASDMSIDVSGEKKDNSETQICTPSSVSSVSQPKFNVTTVLEDKDPKNNPNSNSNSNSEDVVNNNWKEQSGSRAPSAGKAEVVVKTDQGSSQETSKGTVFGEERSGGFKDQVGSDAPAPRGSEVVGRKNQAVSQLSSDTVAAVRDGASSDVKFSGRRVDGGMKNHVVPQSRFHGHSQSLSAQFEGGGGGVGMKFKETRIDVHVEGDSYESTPQPRVRPFTRDVEDSSFSSKQPKDEDSQLPRMKYQRPQQGSREQIRKSHSKRNEVRSASEPDREVLESQDNTRVTSVAPSEQHQRARQSKGNQGLHDELKMKADELEKLFAEHKLRVPVDQSGSVRRIEPVDAHVESTPPLPSRNTVLDPAASSSNVASYDSKSLMKNVDNSPYGDALRQSFSELNFGDDSRGKFYEKYMKKRNAKLREEWSSNRAEKEARMKAMQDSLERSRAEMKAKFSGSINRQDSGLGARRADKVRYFKSNMKRDQHPIDSLQNEEDEDLSEFSEEKIYGTSRHNRKNLPNRNMSSGTPRTTTVSVSRSVGRRRDSLLAQSVPNFSDLRKENTKPYSGASKTTRTQVRNYARSKSANEETQGVKEEKPKQTQSLRKSSANPAEFKDLSPLNSDSVVLSPLKFDMDQTDAGPYDDDQSSLSFLQRGNGIGPLGSAGSAMRRMKASMASDNELDFEEEVSVHMATEELDETETVATKHCAYNNNGKVSLSQGSEKSGNSGSEIGDSTRSLSQVDPISVSEMPTSFPSTFNGVGSLQDSPVESPVSWNSRMRHPFSYPQESSDIDASLDSPIGSPASSWNSHSLTRGDNNDATRMRKKWGNAQPRKDVTKGFKRLLKFGRKSRGSESLVDWISATTSEGDDDTEDGRDPANRSSEDLRKSRMGFSHGHPSDDSFNESELFSEQVQSMQSSIPAPPAHFKLRDDHISGSSLKAPKSFFSLSTFRSKGGDSKPR